MQLLLKQEKGNPQSDPGPLFSLGMPDTPDVQCPSWFHRPVILFMEVSRVDCGQDRHAGQKETPHEWPEITIALRVSCLCEVKFVPILVLR